MKTWTLLDDARILTLLRKGWTRKQIAADFGVTRNAICGKIHRLVCEPKMQPTMPDEDGDALTPNAETVAALEEINSGGGEIVQNENTAAVMEEILAEPEPAPTYFTIRSGNLWVATDTRWLTNPNGTIQGIAHDRGTAVGLYCSAGHRRGNPAPDDFKDLDLTNEQIKEIYAKYPLRWS